MPQVLCSYALHLLDAEALGATLRAAARGARRLLVLTPHKRPTDADVCRAGWVQEGALTLEQVKVRLYRSRECVAAAPVARGGAGRGGACDEAEPRRAGETEPAKKGRRRKKRGRDDGAGSGEARGLE